MRSGMYFTVNMGPWLQNIWKMSIFPPWVLGVYSKASFSFPKAEVTENLVLYSLQKGCVAVVCLK